MWGFGNYGKSYVYDRIHRAAVNGLILMAGVSFIQLGVISFRLFMDKQVAKNDQLAISESETFKTDVKTEGESTTSKPQN